MNPYPLDEKINIDDLEKLKPFFSSKEDFNTELAIELNKGLKIIPELIDIENCDGMIVSTLLEDEENPLLAEKIKTIQEYLIILNPKYKSAEEVSVFFKTYFNLYVNDLPF